MPLIRSKLPSYIGILENPVFSMVFIFTHSHGPIESSKTFKKIDSENERKQIQKKLLRGTGGVAGGGWPHIREQVIRTLSVRLFR